MKICKQCGFATIDDEVLGDFAALSSSYRILAALQAAGRAGIPTLELVRVAGMGNLNNFNTTISQLLNPKLVRHGLRVQADGRGRGKHSYYLGAL